MPNSSNTSVPASPLSPATVADGGKIRTGMGFKILPPTAPPASVADGGKIRTGMGFKVMPASVSIAG